MIRVDLNSNFEGDRLIELSDNKLSNNRNNNLASELVENGTSFKAIKIEEIVFLWLYIIINLENQKK